MKVKLRVRRTFVRDEVGDFDERAIKFLLVMMFVGLGKGSPSRTIVVSLGTSCLRNTIGYVRRDTEECIQETWSVDEDGTVKLLA